MPIDGASPAPAMASATALAELPDSDGSQQVRTERLKETLRLPEMESRSTAVVRTPGGRGDDGMNAAWLWRERCFQQAQRMIHGEVPEALSESLRWYGDGNKSGSQKVVVAMFLAGHYQKLPSEVLRHYDLYQRQWFGGELPLERQYQEVQDSLRLTDPRMVYKPRDDRWAATKWFSKIAAEFVPSYEQMKRFGEWSLSLQDSSSPVDRALAMVLAPYLQGPIAVVPTEYRQSGVGKTLAEMSKSQRRATVSFAANTLAGLATISGLHETGRAFVEASGGFREALAPDPEMMAEFRKKSGGLAQMGTEAFWTVHATEGITNLGLFFLPGTAVAKGVSWAGKLGPLARMAALAPRTSALLGNYLIPGMASGTVETVELAGEAQQQLLDKADALQAQWDHLPEDEKAQYNYLMSLPEPVRAGLLKDASLASEHVLQQIERARSGEVAVRVARHVFEKNLLLNMTLGAVTFGNGRVLSKAAGLGFFSRLPKQSLFLRVLKAAGSVGAESLLEGEQELYQDELTAAEVAAGMTGQAVAMDWMPGKVWRALTGDDPEAFDTALLSMLLGALGASHGIVTSLYAAKTPHELMTRANEVLRGLDQRVNSLGDRLEAQDGDSTDPTRAWYRGRLEQELTSLTKLRDRLESAVKDRGNPYELAVALQAAAHDDVLAVMEQVGQAKQLAKSRMEAERVRLGRELTAQEEELLQVESTELAAKAALWRQGRLPRRLTAEERAFALLPQSERSARIREAIGPIAGVLDPGRYRWRLAESVEELPAKVREQLAGYESGAVTEGLVDPDSGTLFLYAPAMRSVAHAKQKLVHEIAHRELMRYGRDEYNQRMTELYESVGGEAVEALIRERGGNAWMDAWKGRSGDNRAFIAEEFVARLAEKVISADELTAAEKGVWGRVVEVVRKILGVPASRQFDGTSPEVAEFVRGLVLGARAERGKGENGEGQAWREYGADGSGGSDGAGGGAAGTLQARGDTRAPGERTDLQGQYGDWRAREGAAGPLQGQYGDWRAREGASTARGGEVRFSIADDLSPLPPPSERDLAELGEMAREVEQSGFVQLPDGRRIPSRANPANLTAAEVELLPAHLRPEREDALVWNLAHRLRRAEPVLGQLKPTIWFFKDMSDVALRLAKLSPDTTDLYLRFLAYLSPRSTVNVNARRSWASILADMSQFAFGALGGFRYQDGAMSKIYADWKQKRPFTMDQVGVDKKVMTFYLNAMTELSRHLRDDQARKTGLPPVTRLRDVDALPAGFRDHEAATTFAELESRVTVDMWMMVQMSAAAGLEGTVQYGYVQPGASSKGSTPFRWVNPSLHADAYRTVALDSADGQRVKATLASYGEAAKEGWDWSDLSPQERDALHYDPAAGTIVIFDAKAVSDRGLSPGGEGPVYDRVQYLIGRLTDYLNATGGYLDQTQLTAYDGQSLLWASGKLSSPLPKLREFQSFSSSFDEMLEQVATTGTLDTSTGLGKSGADAYDLAAQNTLNLDLADLDLTDQQLAEVEAASDRADLLTTLRHAGLTDADIHQRVVEQLPGLLENVREQDDWVIDSLHLIPGSDNRKVSLTYRGKDGDSLHSLVKDGLQLEDITHIAPLTAEAQAYLHNMGEGKQQTTNSALEQRLANTLTIEGIQKLSPADLKTLQQELAQLTDAEGRSFLTDFVVSEDKLIYHDAGYRSRHFEGGTAIEAGGFVTSYIQSRSTIEEMLTQLALQTQDTQFMLVNQKTANHQETYDGSDTRPRTATETDQGRSGTALQQRELNAKRNLKTPQPNGRGTQDQGHLQRARRLWSDLLHTLRRGLTGDAPAPLSLTPAANLQRAFGRLLDRIPHAPRKLDANDELRQHLRALAIISSMMTAPGNQGRLPMLDPAYVQLNYNAITAIRDGSAKRLLAAIDSPIIPHAHPYIQQLLEPATHKYLQWSHDAITLPQEIAATTKELATLQGRPLSPAEQARKAELTRLRTNANQRLKRRLAYLKENGSTMQEALQSAANKGYTFSPAISDDLEVSDSLDQPDDPNDIPESLGDAGSLAADSPETR